jgi:hypothetical protein
MRNILSPGNKEVVIFECDYCNCKFESNEYDVYKGSAVGVNELIETCPTCGKDLYKTVGV